MAGGRPSKYKPKEHPKLARKMCELGATEKDLADAFGVALSTLSLWKVQHEEFSDALKTGKAPADDRVEASLFHRAVGYSHEDTDIRVVAGKVVKTSIWKHYPPDTTACIFWLKNRRKEEWRADPEGEGSEDFKNTFAELVRNLPG